MYDSEELWNVERDKLLNCKKVKLEEKPLRSKALGIIIVENI
jgi:hypothetical protein